MDLFLRNRFRRQALNQFLILEELIEDELYSSFYINILNRICWVRFFHNVNVDNISLACHICNHTFDDAPRLRRHLLAQHNFSVPPTKRGNRRYDSEMYSYVKCLGKRDNHLVSKHYACTSCLKHFSTLTELGSHIKTHVIPQTTIRKAHPVRYILICLLFNISLTRDFFFRHPRQCNIISQKINLLLILTKYQIYIR